MTKEVLVATLGIAQTHAQRLTQAMNRLSPMMPLTGERFSALSVDNIAYCDLFVNRFSKLQDLMGAKLFGLALDWAEEGPHISFLDKLNALEKLDCIPSAQKWLQLREMRNFLSHEYPDDLNRMAGHFNHAFELTPFLLTCLDNLKSYVDSTTRLKEGG